MKKIIASIVISLIGCCTTTYVKATLVGKLDLSYTDVSAVGARNFTDGFWMAGVEKPIWTLNNSVSGQELLYVAPQYLHGIIDGTNQSLGLAVGVPLGAVGVSIQGLINNFSPSSNVTLPGWVGQISNMTSIEISGGYNMFPQFNYINHFFATVGAILKYPLGSGAKL